jgi:hypothetical protein
MRDEGRWTMDDRVRDGFEETQRREDAKVLWVGLVCYNHGGLGADLRVA